MRIANPLDLAQHVRVAFYLTEELVFADDGVVQRLVEPVGEVVGLQVQGL